MSDTKGHTIQVVNGPAGPSLYLDDYRIAGPKPWGGGTVLHEFAFKDKDLIAAGVTCSAESDQQVSATPAPLDVDDLPNGVPCRCVLLAGRCGCPCHNEEAPSGDLTTFAATPAPLDVERLTDALTELPQTAWDPCMAASVDEVAAAIAAAYAEEKE